MSAEAAATATGGGSKSPKQPSTKSIVNGDGSPKSTSKNATKPPIPEVVALKAESSSTSNAEPSKPLAPPPRPAAQGNNTPDYFSSGIGGSLSLEPNPFEQSFGGAPPETPGGTKLPSVAALTSPSSLLPGGGATPFPWGAGSLRTGPLSPAMLSGPTTDYFSEPHHLRGFPPTPNESSLRTGLTPGGSGSMFPAPSPNSQALFAQIASGGATPSTIDFHRTALSAAAAKREQAQTQTQPPQPAVTSQPQELVNGASVKGELPKPASGPFDPHDNDAANGLFMLARQGRNGSQPQSEYPVPPPQQQPVHAHPPPVLPPQQPQTLPPRAQQQAINDTSPQLRTVNGAPHGITSDRASVGSEENENPRPNTRGKGKKNMPTAPPATNGRRKAEEAPAKAPASKKAKSNGTAAHLASHPSPDSEISDEEDDDDMKTKDGQPRSKMTDEEKRKNFLERNRVAALKCRQRKKQWLANLQNKVEMFSSENDQLTAQIAQLREEVVNLKTLLLAHKDCPVTQQQGMHGAFLQQTTIEYPAPQMNPYSIGAAIPAQPVMAAGQPAARRFS